MLGLFLLPIYDRSPERLITKRPLALTAGLLTIVTIAFLTWSGASTGSPNQVDLTPPSGLSATEKAEFTAGAAVVGESGCLGCHVIGSNGNNGPGPPLTHIGSLLPIGQLASTLKNPTAPMPSFSGLAESSPKKFQNLVYFLSMLQ
jgi:ubiquinol-cytochrome c reductase cytochrome b subunit/menaquinol-cytochrome c reductase cytochrome b/c subunit